VKTVEQKVSEEKEKEKEREPHRKGLEVVYLFNTFFVQEELLHWRRAMSDAGFLPRPVPSQMKPLG
jgi:collagenase-like PrtC family protease